MSKKNITAARRAFVKTRVESTGKQSADDRAKFRERFEKLASTKEGRVKIQEVTGIQGVRKALATEYGSKTPKKSTKSTTPTVTPPTVTPSTLRPSTTAFDLRSTGSVAPKVVGPTTTKAVGPTTTKTAPGKSVLSQVFGAQASAGRQLEKVTKFTRMVTNPFSYDASPRKGIPTLSEYPRMIADAAAVGGFGRALKPALTLGKSTIRGVMGASPKLKAPTSGPVNRALSQPRPGSQSAKLSRPKTAAGIKTTNKKTSKKK